VVGIVDFVERVQTVEFYGLITMATENEIWEMQYDGQDAERRENHGPILAENGLIAVDLLRYMDLHGPADFYDKRGLYFPQAEGPAHLMPGKKKTIYTTNPWRFENGDQDSSPAMQTRSHLLKDAFESLDKMTRIQWTKEGAKGRDQGVFDPRG
jgi:hypothetical protein